MNIQESCVHKYTEHRKHKIQKKLIHEGIEINIKHTISERSTFETLTKKNSSPKTIIITIMKQKSASTKPKPTPINSNNYPKQILYQVDNQHG